jgi:hypothetical protein
MAMSRHFFARSTLMAAVGDAESRIWMVTKAQIRRSQYFA